MKILDNTAINYILKQNISLDEWDIFYIPEDIQYEAYLASFLSRKSVPSNIDLINSNEYFDDAKYYSNYKEMLNKHGGRSFFNMTGLGDISILASVKTVLDNFEKTLPMPGVGEKIEIYVSDRGLIKRLKKEFSTDDRVVILEPEDLTKA